MSFNIDHNFIQIPDKNKQPPSNIHQLNELYSYKENDYSSRKPLFSEFSLLQNLLKVTEAVPFVPLQAYYKIFHIIEQIKQSSKKNHPILQEWYIIESKILFPAEDMVLKVIEQDQKEEINVYVIFDSLLTSLTSIKNQLIIQNHMKFNRMQSISTKPNHIKSISIKLFHIVSNSIRSNLIKFNKIQ